MIIKLLSVDNLGQLETLEKELFTSPFSNESIMSELLSNNRLYVGIFDGDMLIGYAGAMMAVDSADIIKVGVSKQYQKKGYGLRLMTVLLQLLKDNGITSVALEVESNNTSAIGLYTKCGFVEISERKNYYGANCHAKIMQLEL